MARNDFEDLSEDYDVEPVLKKSKKERYVFFRLAKVVFLILGILSLVFIPIFFMMSFQILQSAIMPNYDLFIVYNLLNLCFSAFASTMFFVFSDLMSWLIDVEENLR